MQNDKVIIRDLQPGDRFEFLGAGNNAFQYYCYRKYHNRLTIQLEGFCKFQYIDLTIGGIFGDITVKKIL